MVKSLLTKGRDVLISSQQTLLSAAAILMATTLLSAALGLYRDRLLAGFFGGSPELGIYFLADTIPELLFNLLITGSFTSVFIPLFAKVTEESPSERYIFASRALNSVLLIFGSIAAVLFYFAGDISKLISAGTLTPQQLILCATLFRTMIFAQILLIVSVFLTGVLHSHHRFLPAALAPVAYNSGIIIGTLTLSSKFGILAPAIGMIFGSILHLAVQLPSVKNLGFNYYFRFGIKDKKISELRKLMYPRIIGQILPELFSVFQETLAVTISLASNVFLNFASHIHSFSLSLFGASLAQAVYPTLTKDMAKGDEESFSEHFVEAFRQIMFYVIPLSAILIILRIPSVRVFFGASKFDWEATVNTGYTVAAFAFGLTFFSLNHLLNRAFYARLNTKLPLVVSIIVLTLNLSLVIFLVKVLGLGVWSIAFSASFSAMIQSLILLILLFRTVKSLNFQDLLFPIVSQSLCGLIMVNSMYILFKVLDKAAWEGFDLYFITIPTGMHNLVLDTRYTINLIVFTTIVAFFGILIYFLSAKFLKIPEFDSTISFYSKIIKRIFS